MIDAASQQASERFLPSEFGSDLSSNPKTAKLPGFGYKSSNINQYRGKGRCDPDSPIRFVRKWGFLGLGSEKKLLGSI